MEQTVFTPGTYIQCNQRKYGDVEVTVQLTEDAIASVQVTNHHENTHVAKTPERSQRHSPENDAWYLHRGSSGKMSSQHG